MNKLISLTRLQIKDFLSKYQNSMNLKNKRLGQLIFLLLFVALMIPAFQISEGIYDAFAQMGTPHLTITYIYIGAVMMMFFTGVSFIVSTFFYAKDLKFLASLPVAESTIIFSKLSTVYIYLLGVSGCLFIPAVIVVGMRSGFSVGYVLLSLLALFLTPVLPLAIATLVILPIMRIVGNSRRRNLFSVIVGLLFFVFIIGFQLVIAKQETNPEMLTQILTRPDGLLYFLGQKFPPSIWLTQMIRGSIQGGALFVLLSAGSLLLLQALSRFFYRSALLEFNQESSPVKAGALYYKERSKHTQLVRRHLLIIIKQPTFFLNTIISIFVPVLMIAIGVISGELPLELFRAPELASIAPLLYALIITTPAIVGGISATVISREGKAFWETRVLPISAADNLRARIHSTLVATFTGSFVLGIMGLFLFSLSSLQLLLAVLICISATLFFATSDLIINILRPFLNWTNPTAAVKNNLNVIISLVTRLAVFALGFGIFVLVGEIGTEAFAGILVVLFTVLYVVSRYLVYHPFLHRFNRIDV